MKPVSTSEVIDLLDASYAAAALGAALELGLFWLLDHRPQDAGGIARALGIPPGRCRAWLQVLEEAGLVAETPAGFTPGATARRAILGAFSRPSWAQLAREARERLPGLRDLPVHLGDGGSVYASLGLPVNRCVDQMTADPARARQFTRMLYEIHRPLALALAARLDLAGVGRLLDLGGGSGVISMALVRRHPGLSAVVVDLPNVCAAGREIAREAGLAGRIAFEPADFVRERLPAGCDAALECDVGVYSADLFRKVHAALPKGGRFIVVDCFAPVPGAAPPGRAIWAFERTLIDPAFPGFETADQVAGLLGAAGFTVQGPAVLPPLAAENGYPEEGLAVLEAFA